MKWFSKLISHKTNRQNKVVKVEPETIRANGDLADGNIQENILVEIDEKLRKNFRNI
jgi:predicted transcriptional regulator